MPVAGSSSLTLFLVVVVVAVGGHNAGKLF